MGESEYTVVGTKVSTGLTELPLVGANPQRVAMMLSLSGIGGNVYVSPVGVGPVAPRWVLVAPGNVPVYYKDWGPLVGYAWVVGGAGLVDVYVTELLLLNR